MNQDALTQYLTKVHQEMMVDITKYLGISTDFSFAEVIPRFLLSNACLTITPDGKKRIYVNCTNKGELTEKEIAESEIGVAHETGHMIRQLGNPEEYHRLSTESTLNKSIHPRKHIPLLLRLQDLDETAAEYLALLFIDERQGIETFMERHESLHKSRDLYGRVLQMFRSLSLPRKMELAKSLGIKSYNEVRQIPELEKHIFSKTEKYIETHPKIFQPPYQYIFPEMRSLIRQI